MSDLAVQGIADASVHKEPEVTAYPSAVAYIRDRIEYLKKNEHQFSLRKLAVRAEMTPSYLSMILNETRRLSAEILERLIPHLRLDIETAHQLRTLFNASQGFRTKQTENPEAEELARKLEQAGAVQSKPEIHAYHNYKNFLLDLSTYFRKTSKEFTLSKISERCEIPTSTLSLIFNGKKSLTRPEMERLIPVLNLKPEELKFFELLWVVEEARDPAERERAFQDCVRRIGSLGGDKATMMAYQYLTQWYFLAIREMADMRGFRLDEEWIQRVLQYWVSKVEIRRALDYLVQNQYIVQQPNGTYRTSSKEIKADGGSYRIKLRDCHQQMLTLTKDALENIPLEKRFVTSHTFSLNGEEYQKITKILTEARERVAEFGRTNKTGDKVYHVSMSVIPLADLGNLRGGTKKSWGIK